jgi:tRNA nucleotidyltransferase/poly(A) polymerase
MRGHQVQQLHGSIQQENDVMSNLIPLAGWWRMMESMAEGQDKRKQRFLNKKQMLKRDPLHLAWWNMWWLRMERVANSEEKARTTEINRQVAANKMRKFLDNTCMTPDKKKRNGNHICTTHTESARKRQQLSNTYAESPAKKMRLNNFTTALQFWVRGAENNENISRKPDDVIQVRNQRIITPISVKLRDGTDLGISSGDNDERVA